jgi:hypothetical protein
MYAIQTLQGYCPYCAEPIDLVVDSSEGDSCYIEDCQVCCRPISVSVTVGQAGEARLELRHEDEG